jgi:hypothetical protein
VISVTFTGPALAGLVVALAGGIDLEQPITNAKTTAGPAKIRQRSMPRICFSVIIPVLLFNRIARQEQMQSLTDCPAPDILT